MDAKQPQRQAPDEEGDPRSLTRRITGLLAALTSADGEGLSGAELGRRVGLPPATAHRLLVDLEREGVTVRRVGTRAWTLGGVMIGWGDAATRQQLGRSQFHEALHAIGRSTRETVVLTAREGWHGTHVDLVESPTRLRIVEHVGLRLPLTIGASRRAILAFLPDAERQRVLARYAPTGREGTALRRDLDQTLELGFSLSSSQVTAYSVGIAVPVLTDGYATASIMVGGPALRVKAPELVHALEMMQKLIRPRSLLPPVALDQVPSVLAAAEKMKHQRPIEL